MAWMRVWKIVLESFGSSFGGMLGVGFGGRGRRVY